jgi:hypothetical protein
MLDLSGERHNPLESAADLADWLDVVDLVGAVSAEWLDNWARGVAVERGWSAEVRYQAVTISDLISLELYLLDNRQPDN